MMSVQQLSVAIDSIDDDKNERFRRLYKQTVRFFYPMKKKWQAQLEREQKEKNKEESNVIGGVDYEKYMDKSPKKVDNEKIKQKSVGKPKKKKDKKKKKKNSTPKKSGRTVLEQKIEKPLAEYNSFAELEM